MFTWLTKLFKRNRPAPPSVAPPRPIPITSLSRPVRIVDEEGCTIDDPVLENVVNLCMTTGNMVFANIDGDDNVLIEQAPDTETPTFDAPEPDPDQF